MPQSYPNSRRCAPELTQAELDDAEGARVDAAVDGIIATNTTRARDGLRAPSQAEAGGLSGRPLRERSLACVQAIVHLAGGRLPVVAAGGIAGPEDARRALDAGAVLVQVYTGLVHRGPGLVWDILHGLID
jgi:dihydroorotate dehydrogenase